MDGPDRERLLAALERAINEPAPPLTDEQRERLTAAFVAAIERPGFMEAFDEAFGKDERRRETLDAARELAKLPRLDLDGAGDAIGWEDSLREYQRHRETDPIDADVYDAIERDEL